MSYSQLLVASRPPANFVALSAFVFCNQRHFKASVCISYRTPKHPRSRQVLGETGVHSISLKAAEGISFRLSIHSPWKSWSHRLGHIDRHGPRKSIPQSLNGSQEGITLISQIGTLRHQKFTGLLKPHGRLKVMGCCGKGIGFKAWSPKFKFLPYYIFCKYNCNSPSPSFLVTKVRSIISTYQRRATT